MTEKFLIFGNLKKIYFSTTLLLYNNTDIDRDYIAKKWKITKEK